MADFYFQVTDTAQQRTNLLNFLLSSVANSQGAQGQDGDSAYEIAITLGFIGTEQQWLDSLKGVKGDTGQSYAPNAFGNTSDRSLYDNELAGFGFLDVTQSLLFIKKSNTSGDWFNGMLFGKGEKGEKGDTGDNITSVTSSKTGKTTTVNVFIENVLANSFNVEDGNDGFGAGDMTKAIYDANNNGKVDIAELAESAPWNGITDKPLTFAPSTHNHDDIYFTETEVQTSLPVIGFNTETPTTPSALGQMAWNIADRTIEVNLGDGVVLQCGQEHLILVKNNTASIIPNGRLCMATGSVGASGKITVSQLDGTVQTNADKIVGIATQDIAVGGFGFVTTHGTVRGIDTSSLTEGEPIYASTTVIGGLTTTPPTVGMKLKVGVVIYSHATVGTILFRSTILDENLYAKVTGSTGVILVPSGTTAQRPTLSVSDTAIRYNTTLSIWESWNGTSWSTIGGGVSLTGDQTIAGIKTFTSSPVVAGIKVGNTAISDASTIDWYEEGTFTPVIVGGTTAGTGTYEAQVGKYTRVGDLVTIELQVTCSAHTGTGVMRVAGLPFANNSGIAIPMTIMSSLLTYSSILVGYIPGSATYVAIGAMVSAGSLSDTTLDSACTIWIRGTFKV